MAFLNEWQVFGGEASYFDTVNKKAVRGAKINKVQIIFTDVPQPSGEVFTPPDEEKQLVISDSATLDRRNTLQITVYLSEEYLFRPGTIDKEVLVTKLVMQTLYPVFHPGAFSSSEAIQKGRAELASRLNSAESVIFSFHK